MFKYDPNIIRVVGWGEWHFMPQDEAIYFLSSSGALREFPQHPLLHLDAYHRSTLVNEVSGLVLMMDRAGEVLYSLNSRDGIISIVSRLNRSGPEERDGGLCWSRFEKTDEYLLLVYEAGAICVSVEGVLLWHHQHNLDWHFVSASDDIVIFQSDWRGRWGYRTSDGACIAL